MLRWLATTISGPVRGRSSRPSTWTRAASDSGPGTWPRSIGFAGFVTLKKWTPLEPPTIAYSSLVSGSAQPQTSAIPPVPVTRLTKSMFLQGSPAALPFLHFVTPPFMAATAVGAGMTAASTEMADAAALVAAGAGLQVEREDADGYPGRLATAIASVVGDAGLAERLRFQGLDRAGAFSWQDSAQKVWQLHADL